MQGITALNVKMKNKFLRHIALLILGIIGLEGMAQDNDRILNRPYADNKPVHFGFSVGTHVQDLQFTHNGYVSEKGETWYMEVPDFSPGFNVTVLADYRLGKYFNLRLSPGMFFGNKVVKMMDTTNGVTSSQNIKTNFVVLPLDLKISSERYYNIRPYALVGGMMTFDVSKKRSEQLMLKTSDFMLSVGFGCDIYLPFFKLCPELKFCFGLTDMLQHKRPDLSDDPETMKYTNSLKKVTQQMVVLSFYFE